MLLAGHILPRVDVRTIRLLPVVCVACLSVAALIAAGIANLVQIDFRFIHTAGRMWSQGLDPYGPGFAAFDPALPDEPIWAYPPQWWAISTVLAELPIGQAFVVWRAISLAALVAGALIFVRTATKLAPVHPAALMAFALWVAASDPTMLTLALGQTSALVFFGFALLVNGFAEQRSGRSTAGLVILLLKPQFGLVCLLLSLRIPALRKPALAALLVTGTLALPLLLQFGIRGTADSAFALLDNLSRYASLKWNRPLELSGLQFLIAALFGFGMNSGLLTLAALLVGGVRLSSASDPARFWIVLLTCCLFLLPLHGYDFVMGGSLVLLVSRLRPWAAVLTTLALGLIWSPFNLSGLIEIRPALHGQISPGTLMYVGWLTLSAALLFVAGFSGQRLGTQAGIRQR